MKAQGTQEQKPLALEFGKDTVYRRSSIVRVQDEQHGDFWEYDEEQFTYSEYVKVLQQEQEQGNDDIKMALAELAEAILGG